MTAKTALVVVVLASLGAALAWSGAEPARATGVVDHDFVGADRCRSCHVEEYAMWERSPHARAYDVLSPAERKDPRCLACHSMVPTDVRVELLGIQCESCHGAGRHYSAEYVMRDDDLRARLGFERGDARTCARCHTDSSPSLIPFQYDEKLNAIRHWREKPAPASKGTGKQP